ncbi:MAG: hypothetical protein AAB479_00890 [Patescibacteria group bacterium]
MKRDEYRVIVASIRPADLLKWISAWGWDRDKLIIVEDLPRKSDLGAYFPNHFSHSEIDAELGDNSWIIPRKTSAIKSFGVYVAYRQNVDWVIVLDDDCYPTADKESFVSHHFQNLNRQVDLNWVATGDQYTRGYPYFIRGKSEVILSHGLWDLYPDYDAVMSLARPGLPFNGQDQVIPRWNFFPMCGMNVAFNIKIAPLMYFGLQGLGYPFDRFDDIWCGVFAKKIIDHLGLAVFSGQPAIQHTKLSNLLVNLRKEAPGIEENESVWQAVQAVVLTKKDIIPMARELFENVMLESDFWAKYRKAALTWLNLFDPTNNVNG